MTSPRSTPQPPLIRGFQEFDMEVPALLTAKPPQGHRAVYQPEDKQLEGVSLELGTIDISPADWRQDEG
jgi:hypothetical protein